MNPKTKEKIVFGVLLVSGIALCGLSFVFPPLAVLGAAFLAGSLAVLANILQDKDRVTVNNNYSNYAFVEKNPGFKTAETFKLTPSPSNKIGSLFGFKNKKYMDHHAEMEKHHIEEHESNSMQLSPEMLDELAKLSVALQQMSTDFIDKFAHDHKSKSHDEEPPMR